MKTISFLNMKGGVGKTTVCLGTSYELAKMFSKKVLIIDLDQQTNASLMTLKSEIYRTLDIKRKTIADLIKKEDGLVGESKKKNLSDFIIDTAWSDNTTKISIVPSSIRLFQTKRTLHEYTFSENLVRDFLKTLPNNSYDYCMIDLPPDFDRLVVSALVASDYYLIPMRPDYLSEQGLVVLEKCLEEIESYIRCKRIGIVITMVPGTRGHYHKQLIKKLKDRFGDTILTEIGQKQGYAEWPESHEPLSQKKLREPFIEIAKRILETEEDGS